MKTALNSLLLATQLGGALCGVHAQQKKLNILFIAIDDLKPELGCYGNSLVKTPNIDRLAQQGTVFLNNYCQQAVSGATRASMLTGLRPDHTQVWDLKTRMRDVNPDILSMPQYFISQGYETAGIGKVYDPRCVDKDIDKPSWSIPYYKKSDKYLAKHTGKPLMGYQLPETKALIEKYQSEGQSKGLDGKELDTYVQGFIKPSVECADVPDNAYDDGANILHAKDILSQLAKGDKPFFLAVGIAKPHLPFVSPKKYWDLYKRTDMPIAKFQKHALNSPEYAYHASGEMRSYSDIPPLCSFTDQQNNIGLPLDKQQELIHGYYAAISYADALVGGLLAAVDSLGLSQNTIIVLWGDHGWHLGDHDLWNKHTNFENATHAPLIISSPGLNAGKTNSLTEFVDVFPTLCDLTGMPSPGNLDGVSLLPVLKNPATKVNEFAVSQYPRSGKVTKMKTLAFSEGKIMGYSIRTDKYRYTMWLGNGFRTTKPFDENMVLDAELYDYTKDPLETDNVVNSKNYQAISKELKTKMISFFKSQAKR